MADENEVRAVPFAAIEARRLEPIVGTERIARLEAETDRVRELLGGRRVVNLNSTAAGGGVAEMLRTLLGYVRGVGIDVEWLVIHGEPPFFEVTKRIHNGLYGGPGDGGELDEAAGRIYDRVLAATLPSLRRALRSDDIVVVHDPQPAGLVPALLDAASCVVWRCHVGVDVANGWSERAWGFLRPYVEGADLFVFSRGSFAPAWVDDSRLQVIPPSIDPFTPKNRDLDGGDVVGLLGGAGLIVPDGRISARVRPARVVRSGAAPGLRTPLVVQVSRWDPMKDMVGVMAGFTEHVPRSLGAQLVLAGPEVDGVDDDPEALEVWDRAVVAWHRLAPADRERVHLAAIPMEDLEENALVVNALQRHAAVVVQKSLAEGFGLTVAEAMWKSRPVVASAVGGIVDQVVDGETGFLHEPHDLERFGALVRGLLADPAGSRRLGENGRQRVAERFLADRHLLQWAELLGRVAEGRGPVAPTLPGTGR